MTKLEAALGENLVAEALYNLLLTVTEGVETIVVEHDLTAPFEWSVWCGGPDDAPELLGASNAITEALTEAIETVRAWNRE